MEGDSGNGFSSWNSNIGEARRIRPSSSLKENITISNTSYFENTCEALVYPVRHQSHSLNVKILLLTGQNNDGRQWKIIARSLFDASGKVDYTSPSKEYELPIGDYLEPKTDNHLIKFRDGDLLANKACSDFEPINNPQTWQDIPMFDKEDDADPEKKGLRGSQVIWNSKDGEHWNYYGKVDPFVIENPKYSYPVPLDCKREYVSDFTQRCTEPGKYGYGGPGWDRQELYACPFTGYLYLTSWFRGGPYDDLNQKVWNCLLLCSLDKGKTWKVLKDDFPDRRPLVMTSTPNGRLFIYHWTDSGGGMLYCSNLFTPPEYPIIFKAGDIDKQIWGGGSSNIDSGFPPAWPQKRFPSISRISTDTSTNKVRVSNVMLNEYGRQALIVLNIEVYDEWSNENFVPTIKTILVAATLQPGLSKTHSMTLGAFVDPDYVKFPSGFKSNTAMFYWLEYPMRLRLGGIGFTAGASAHYAIFRDEKLIDGPCFLTVKNGQDRRWSPAPSGYAGHYQTGGFFLYKDTLNYVAHWREPDGIKANIVTVKYH